MLHSFDEIEFLKLPTKPLTKKLSIAKVFCMSPHLIKRGYALLYSEWSPSCVDFHHYSANFQADDPNDKQIFALLCY